MDAVLPQHVVCRFADPKEHSIARRHVAAQLRDGVPAASRGRLAGQPLRLRSPRNAAAAQGDGQVRRGRRPSHKRRLVVFQSAVGRRRRDHRRRLAGPVGRPVRSRRRSRRARPRGAGTRPDKTPARRRDPLAADGAPVLARRSLPLAEPLAALDDGPQHAQSRRQAAAASVRRVQFAGLRGDDQGQRTEPDHAHRPVLGGRAEAGLLVDGRRLVHPAARLAAGRHLGGRSRAIPARVPPDQRPCPRQGRQDPGLVRAGASDAGNVAVRAAPGMAVEHHARPDESAGRHAILVVSRTGCHRPLCVSQLDARSAHDGQHPLGPWPAVVPSRTQRRILRRPLDRAGRRRVLGQGDLPGHRPEHDDGRSHSARRPLDV